MPASRGRPLEFTCAGCVAEGKVGTHPVTGTRGPIPIMCSRHDAGGRYDASGRRAAVLAVRWALRNHRLALGDEAPSSVVEGLTKHHRRRVLQVRDGSPKGSKDAAVWRYLSRGEGPQASPLVNVPLLHEVANTFSFEGPRGARDVLREVARFQSGTMIGPSLYPVLREWARELAACCWRGDEHCPVHGHPAYSTRPRAIVFVLQERWEARNRPAVALVGNSSG